MWESHEKFRPHLSELWNEEGAATNMKQLQEKLFRVSGSLDHWSKDTFGNVRREIRILNERLDALRADEMRQSPSYEETKITSMFVELYEREEVMWRQRSRIQWLAEGDKNTRFFHLRSSKRKKKNQISRLKKSDGDMTEDVQEMAEMTSGSYEDLYRSEGTSNMGEVIDVILCKVIEEMNNNLLKPFEEGEVKTTLFQMFPTKAPGPDTSQTYL
jgi:hypothetical protein